jgi:proline iminopeptidase
VRAVLFFAGTVLVAGAFSLTVLRPMGDEQLLPAPVAGQRFWELSTGSRLAYVRVPTEGEARPEPVIFLHGGPGIPDMRGDVRYFGDLSREGFDVYIYDLVGRGSSSRLDDPRHYTLGRDVRDLEEVRRKIGAERMILVGHSHGGMVAAAYAASHPDHVAKLVLSSPEDPSPAARLHHPAGESGSGPQLRRGCRDGRPLRPRVQPEQVRPSLRGRTFGTQAPRPRLLRSLLPQSAAREPHADFLPDLAGLGAPALVIKGSCDYVSWSSAQECLRVLPEARLAYLDGAGHNAYQDEPGRYTAQVRAFLLGRPLPEGPYKGSRMPDDYEGPS